MIKQSLKQLLKALARGEKLIKLLNQVQNTDEGNNTFKNISFSKQSHSHQGKYNFATTKIVIKFHPNPLHKEGTSLTFENQKCCEQPNWKPQGSKLHKTKTPQAEHM